MIAVVDDEAPVRIAVGRLLRLAGYVVDTFPSGETFLDSLRTGRPDCVILDVRLPGLTGFEVHSRLAAEAIEIPVVFITASNDLARAPATPAPANIPVLRKPFSNQRLLDAVGAALQIRQRMR